MSINQFLDLYKAAGFTVQLNEDELQLEIEGHKYLVTIDSEWKESINSFYKAKQYTFVEARRMLKAYKSIEVQLARIDPNSTFRPDYEFTDAKDNLVRVTLASHEFSIALMSCKGERSPMEIIKRRLIRRAGIRKPSRDGYIHLHKFDDILVIPTTARYTTPRKIDADLLLKRATKAIKGSLFSLSYNLGESWELRERIQSIEASIFIAPLEPDYKIPKSSYSDDLVTFYKVARSSVFPNQEFLSYYHILEYHFLRVSDEILHTNVKSLINSPSFNTSYGNVNKLVSVVKKNDSSSDETEMLKSVIKKYIDEDDLIEHIKLIEKKAGKAIYTDTKNKVFGENISIRLDKGHVIGTAAKVIKQVRNALVHSSDKYNREDCFIPFSETESVVINHIPLIKFVAEKIIFATAEDD
jgi:hypothetical protein